MPSEREPIQRFFGKNSLSNTDFMLVLRSLFKLSNGSNISLDGNDVFLSEKMDALFCCFGIDENENFFMSSNNSGVITAENKEKFNNVYLSDFYKSFGYLEKLQPFQSALKNIYNHIGPVKFCSELFPTLTHQGDENGDVVFVATKYNKKNLGENGASFIFDVKRWNPSLKEWVNFEDKEQKSQAIDEMLQADTSKWRIYELNKHGKLSGILNADVTPFAPVFESEESFNSIMSLIKKEGDEKNEFINVIEKTRKSLQDSLDFYAENSNSIFGEMERRYPIEGVVLTVNMMDGRNIKIKGTSRQFNEKKESNWNVRNQLSDIEKEFNNSIMKDVLGLKSSDNKFVNEKIKQVAANFRSSKIGEKRENDFIEKLLDELQEVKLSESEVKANLKNILDAATAEIKTIKSNNIQATDPDTQRKNSELMGRLENILGFIKKSANVNYYKGDDFVNYIAKIIFAKKLEPVMDSIKENINEDGSITSNADEPTKCLVWLGRAQPWHQGHHKMIVDGIKEARNRGVSEICIFVVKGAETSKDVTKNPLNENEQIKLLNVLYNDYDWSADGIENDDIKVSICQKALPDGFIPKVLRKLYESNKMMSGLLAGEDRIDDYRKQLESVERELSFKDKNNNVHKAEYSVIDDSVGDILIPISRSGNDKVSMSGTEARHLSTISEFSNWLSKVAPKGASKNAVIVYKSIFNEMSSRLSKVEEEGYRSKMKGIFWGNI